MITAFLILLMAACRAKEPASPPAADPAQPISQPGAPGLKLTNPEIALAVQQATGASLAQEAVRENNGVSYVEFPVVSSGEIVTATLPMEGNPEMNALIAYLPTRVGVVELPIPFGYSLEDGYLFMDSSLTTGEAGRIDREAAINEIRRRFPRGQALTLTQFKYVSLSGVDWNGCLANETDARFLSVCRLAAEYNKKYPDSESLFISRIPAEGGWLPVGWWFSPYFEDLQVALPEESTNQ